MKPAASRALREAAEAACTAWRDHVLPHLLDIRDQAGLTFRVLVVGASNVREGDPDFQTAVALGEQLGERGIGAVTGGLYELDGRPAGIQHAVLMGLANAGRAELGIGTPMAVPGWGQADDGVVPTHLPINGPYDLRILLMSILTDCVVSMERNGTGTIDEVARILNAHRYFSGAKDVADAFPDQIWPASLAAQAGFRQRIAVVGQNNELLFRAVSGFAGTGDIPARIVEGEQALLKHLPSSDDIIGFVEQEHDRWTQILVNAGRTPTNPFDRI